MEGMERRSFECRLRAPEGQWHGGRFWSDNGLERLMGHMAGHLRGHADEKFEQVSVWCIPYDEEGKPGDAIQVLPWPEIEAEMTAEPRVFRVLPGGRGWAGFLLPDLPPDASETRKMNRARGGVTPEERAYLDEGQTILESRCRRLAETAFKRAANLREWSEALSLSEVAAEGLKSPRKTGL